MGRAAQATLKIGYNVGDGPVGSNMTYCGINWLKRAASDGSGGVTFRFDGKPLTMTATPAAPASMTFGNQGSNVSTGGGPLPCGTWALVWDEINPGANAMQFALVSLNGNWTRTSGTTTPGTAGTGVTALTVTSG